MRGFRLIAITEKGSEAIKEFERADRKATIKRISSDPLTVSFIFKPRYAKLLSEPAINTFVNLTFKARGCKIDKDYKIEVSL